MKRKLHSRRGASMLIALLFFLTAMTVGAVVLTAASANAGRTARTRQEQQNYLAVASAAELVKEDIAGAAFTAGYRKTVVEIYYPATYDAEGKLVSSSYTTWSTSYQFETDGAYGAKIENSTLTAESLDALKRIYGNTLPAEVTDTPKWDAAADADVALRFQADDMPAVTGRLAVNPEPDSTTGLRRYALTAVLGVEPEREGGPSPYASTMEFAPLVTEQVKTDPPKVEGSRTTYVTHYITAVTWEAPVITKGAEL